MKKASLIISVILIVLLGAWAYWHFIFNRTQEVDPLNAVPSDAIVILEIKDGGEGLRHFYKSSLLYKDFGQTPLAKDFDGFISLLDTLPEEQELSISVHKLNGAYSTLICLADPVNKLKGIINTSGQPDGEVESVFTISGLPYYFTYDNNIVMASLNADLLNSAKYALEDRTSVKAYKSFLEIRQLAEKDAVHNLFLNVSRIKGPLSEIIQIPEFKPILNFAGWVVLDLYAKANLVSGHGFVKYDSGGNDSLVSFLDQQPQSLKYFEVIPSKTAFFVAFGMSNPPLLIENLSKENATDLQRNELDTYLKSWMGSTIGLGVLENDNEDEISKFIFIEVKDSISFRDKAAPFLADSSDYISFWGYGFSRFNQSFNLEHLLGESQKGITNPYFVLYDSYVFVANNPNTLRTIIKQNKNDKTIAKHDSFSQIKEELLDDASSVYYLSPAVGKNFLTKYLKDSVLMKWLPREPEINNLQAFVIQFSNYKKGLIYAHTIIRHHPVELIKETHGLWDLPLGEKVTRKPEIVRDYKSGNYDILVQDIKNNLYLVSNTGELLWKYPLGKPILGKTNQIDIYKNGRLQLLFNTTDSLYCIDRKGRNVAKYPIALPESTTNALALFDYDRKLNYRIVIGTTQGRLLMYDAKGVRVRGWKFNKAKSAITEQAQHLKLGKKDYIVSTTANGTLFLLDRKGKSRYKVKENVGDKFGASYLFARKDIASSGVFYIDTLGQVIKLTFGGKKEYLPIKGIPGDKLIVSYIKSEKSRGFFIFNEFKIAAYLLKGEKLFDDIVVKSLNSSPNLYRLNDDNWIGYNDSETKMAYLINFSGKPYNAFPINGLSPISIKDINKDGIMEMVIADLTGGIIVYGLNE